MSKTREAQELLSLASKMALIRANPFLSRQNKRDKILDLIGGLSSKAFDAIYPKIMIGLNIFGDKQFKDSEDELEFIVSQYPKFKYGKSIIRERIKTDRMKAKLEI